LPRSLPIPIVRMWITPGFTAEQQHIVSLLMRLDLIAAVIFSISGLVVGWIASERAFPIARRWLPSFITSDKFCGAAILAPCRRRFISDQSHYQRSILAVYGLAYGVNSWRGFASFDSNPGPRSYGFRWTPSIKIQ